MSDRVVPMIHVPDVRAGVEGASVTFHVEAGRAVGLTFGQVGTMIEMRRLEDVRRPQEDS
jgi:hypothetical protein